MKLLLEHRYVKTNHITLHLVQAGPKDGPIVILLHGFPEFWYGWRHQIPALAEAGFRVWVPDQRGYNLSDKPAGIAAYKRKELVADVLGLLATTNQSAVYVVGHDWGGIVGWWLANSHPERVTKMVIMNVPHPLVMEQFLWRSPLQFLKSSYAFFFQLPWLPETAVRANNWLALVQAMRASSRPDTFTTADFTHYRHGWAQPGAITAMLNWYRAAARYQQQIQAGKRIQVPTLLLWGKRDHALRHEMAQPSIDLCDDGRLIFFEEASHWLQHEIPDQVNRLIIEFLG